MKSTRSFVCTEQKHSAVMIATASLEQKWALDALEAKIDESIWGSTWSLTAPRIEVNCKERAWCWQNAHRHWRFYVTLSSSQNWLVLELDVRPHLFMQEGRPDSKKLDTHPRLEQGRLEQGRLWCSRWKSRVALVVLESKSKYCTSNCQKSVITHR